jgi:YbbR domain-containing protein
VAGAVADVNLTGLRVNIEQDYDLTARDARGGEIKGVRIEPDSLDLTVPIVQKEVTLTLTVVPAVQGTVADGYNLVGVSSEPQAIAVSGPLEVLQALSFVTTEPIDASGLRSETTRTLRLRIPAGLQSTRDSVSVRLKVEPAQGQIALTVAPQVNGVGEGLRPSLQTASVTVYLSGPLPTLRLLTPASLRASISASGLDEGIHVLRPTITAPEGIQVASVEPNQVVVVLRR